MSKPYEALFRLGEEQRKEAREERSRTSSNLRRPRGSRLPAHALLWGGLATMIGGLYMLAGTGWAALIGGFMVYAVGSDLLRKPHEREAVKSALIEHLQGGQTAGQSFAAALREMQRQSRPN